jgi:branched-chain amino acid transport system substrate-binding protein
MLEQSRSVSRREFLKIAGLAGAAVAAGAGLGGLLTACGGGETTTTTGAAVTTTGGTAGPTTSATTVTTGGTTATSAATETTLGNAPEYITIGDADAFSGWASADAQLNQYSMYDLWAEDVNKDGGILVKEYGKKIPVKMVYYDNKSDPATAVKMFEKLMTEDKVNFVVAPWGTAWHFATAPLANQYGYMMMGVTVSSDQLIKRVDRGDLPFYFTAWLAPAEVAPDVVDLLVEKGVKSVAILYVSTSYGIEYYAALKAQCEMNGIAVKVEKSYPFDILDTSPMLKECQSQQVDALLAPCYGPDGAILVEQMISLNYNPKLVWLGSATWSSPTFIDKFGKPGIEGIYSEMGWNTQAGAGGQEFWDRYIAKYKREPDVGCGPIVYATMQAYQQAIEQSGTLDRKKVRDVVASGTFKTIAGDITYGEKQYWRTPPFVVGQWQSGEYVAIQPKDKRKADPIYPKPDWIKK